MTHFLVLALVLASHTFANPQNDLLESSPTFLFESFVAARNIPPERNEPSLNKQNSSDSTSTQPPSSEKIHFESFSHESLDDSCQIDQKPNLTLKEIQEYAKTRQSLAKGRDRKNLDKKFLQMLSKYGDIDQEAQDFLKQNNKYGSSNQKGLSKIIINGINDHFTTLSSPIHYQNTPYRFYHEVTLNYDQLNNYIVEHNKASTKEEKNIVDTKFLSFLDDNEIIDITQNAKQNLIPMIYKMDISSSVIDRLNDILD